MKTGRYKADKLAVVLWADALDPGVIPYEAIDKTRYGGGHGREKFLRPWLHVFPSSQRHSAV